MCVCEEKRKRTTTTAKERKSNRRSKPEPMMRVVDTPRCRSREISSSFTQSPFAVYKSRLFKHNESFALIKVGGAEENRLIELMGRKRGGNI